jgi:hypothetical protein
MASKLDLYNAALIEIGDRTLASLSESVESRRILDSVYDRVVAECLAAGQWNFAARPLKVTSDTGVTPAFGETEVFLKPTDFVRLTAISGDENFSYPLLDYTDEVDRWVGNVSPMYVKYISNGASYGLNLTAWPELFTRYVELSLALRIVKRLTDSQTKYETIMRDQRQARKQALNVDTMNEAQPKFAPPSGWTMSRWGRGGGRRDRGNRGSLLG